jgi:hypothetical protein
MLNWFDNSKDELDKKIDAFEARMDKKIAELEIHKDELIKENQEKIEEIKSLKDSINIRRNN